ncbi:MAG TPA: DUF4328 domain-containing protein [Candidatus Dormibacteraeota bacterium]
MSGQFSPDGLWYWDGAQWRQAISPDGHWRWNGTAWQPAAAPPQIARAAAHYESPGTLAILVQLAFAALIAGDVIFVPGEVLVLMGFTGPGDQLGAGDVVAGIGGLIYLGAHIATIVLFLLWIHRAYRNLGPLGAQGLRHSPGWAVGWWFVPFASLWKPYQVMREIWWHSAGPGRAWTLLKVWWAAWLISNWVGNFASRMPGPAGHVAAICDAGSHVAAAMLAVLVVRRLTAWQEERAQGRAEAAPAGEPYLLPLGE